MQRRVDHIYGPTGAGKTYRAGEMFNTSPRAVLADADFAEFNALYFPTLEALNDHLDKIGAYTNPVVPFRVAYTPRNAAEFDVLCEIVYELGSVRFFIEEADRFPEPGEIYWFNEIYVRGRHKGVDVVLLALHPFLISKEWRRQTTSLVTFRQIEPSDIEWLEKFVGPLARELPKLAGPPDQPPFPYLEWRPSHGAKIIHPGGHVQLEPPTEEKEKT